MEIKRLAQERMILQDGQRRYRARGWRISEILKGEIKDY